MNDSPLIDIICGRKMRLLVVALHDAVATLERAAKREIEKNGQPVVNFAQEAPIRAPSALPMAA